MDYGGFAYTAGSAGGSGMSGWAALAEVAKKGLDMGFGNYAMKSNFQHQRKLQQNQFDFTERMSSSAYQRAVQDMLKAGLNPVLALGGPASTPGGSGGGSAMPGAGAPMDIPGAILTAKTAKQVQKNTELLEQRRKTEGWNTQAALGNAGIAQAENVMRAVDARNYQRAFDMKDPDTGRYKSEAERQAAQTAWMFRHGGWKSATAEIMQKAMEKLGL